MDGFITCVKWIDIGEEFKTDISPGKSVPKLDKSGESYQRNIIRLEIPLEIEMVLRCCANIENFWSIF